MFSYESQSEIPVSSEQGCFCDECGTLMEFGEEAVELFWGRIGRGQKSGQPMVVDMHDDNDAFIPVKLHLWCVQPFMDKHIYDVQDDPRVSDTPPAVCEICSQKLEGAHGD